MDPMTIVALAAIGAIPVCAAIGAAVGFQFGRRTKVKKYVCGCGHPLAAHDPDTKKCHATWTEYEARNPRGEYIGKQQRPCACRRYVGEVPPDMIDWPNLMLPTRSDGGE